jgi:hypothetical protein
MNLVRYCLNLKNELKIFIPSADWITLYPTNSVLPLIG